WIYFLLEDDRSYHLARVAANGGVGAKGEVTAKGGKVGRVISGRRTIMDVAVGPGGKVAVLSSTPQEPPEIFAVEGGSLRPVTRQNQELVARWRLGVTEETSFKSKDGTVVNGLLVKPP